MVREEERKPLHLVSDGRKGQYGRSGDRPLIHAQAA